MDSPPSPVATLLGDLDVVIDDVACHSTAIPVASYGGPRPTSTVVLAGRGVEGRGEHVGWTDAAHVAFRAVTARVSRGRSRLADWSAALDGHRYDRAALEAAAIDLALRQRGTNLFRLAGIGPRAVRYVVSVATLAEARAEPATVELKLDVDPARDAATYATLPRVAILDFKGRGPADDAHRALPDALLEDPRPPWSPVVRDRITLDASIASAADVAHLDFRPAAVNLKPARMGGVLEALRAAAACAARGIPVYLGGMFELGVGRLQLRVLAACLAPDGPNDIAPIGVGDAPPARPPRLPVDADDPGFG